MSKKKKKLHLKFTNLTVPLSADSKLKIKKGDITKLVLSSKQVIFCRASGSQYTEKDIDHVDVEEIKMVSDDKVDHSFNL